MLGVGGIHEGHHADLARHEAGGGAACLASQLKEPGELTLSAFGLWKVIPHVPHHPRVPWLRSRALAAWALGGVDAGAGARLPVGFDDVFVRRVGRAH